MCSWPVSRNIITGNTERDYGFLLNHVGVVTIDRPLSGVSGQTLPQASFQDRFDFWARLPVPIYTTLPLFQAIRIPRQVIVQNCIEVILKVDALAEAISCHQNAMFGLGLGLNQVLDQSLPFLVAAARSGHGNRTEILALVAQASIQFIIRHILRGRNETAVDDWMKALLNQRQQEVGGFRDFGIVLCF